MQNNITSYSQIQQDITVLSFLKNKNNGIFVDIGCAGPTRFSNTYLLEKLFNWKGLALDIQNETDGIGEWKDIRPNSTHIICDALKVNYKDLFEANNLPNVIDYLSLDLEPPQLTLDCLFKIPFDRYVFNVITFETDEYRMGGEERVKISRNYLSSFGYVFVKTLNRQDDVYIHQSVQSL